MLERVDRVQLAVRDRRAATRTFAELLGGVPTREADSAYLNARRSIIRLGESEVELCEPSGPGPLREYLERWGEGLMTAGFAVRDTRALRARLAAEGVDVAEDSGQAYLEPPATAGMRVVLTPSWPAPRAGARLYEVTNTLVSDWKVAADRYSRLFGLDPSRFSPIRSERFGYVGTLTLFDPPARLDRIELSQVVSPASAMGRWVARRGDSLYMCYLETDDVPGIVRRLEARGARWTPRGGDPKTERDGLWIHPSALHGLLLGVSRPTLAWEWSGRPTLVAPGGETMEPVKDSRRLYDVERRARHAERPGFRITELQISPAQKVPWHSHTNVQDTFYVLEGRLGLFLRDPTEEIPLGRGETYTVRAGRPHLVTNAGQTSAVFLVLQGIGEYDYVPLT